MALGPTIPIIKFPIANPYFTSSILPVCEASSVVRV